MVRNACRLFQPSTAQQANMMALGAGLLATLALPPFEVWVMTIPSLCALFLITQQQSFKSGFIRGLWFGLGYFVSNLYWIAFALGVELEQFYWLIPFAVLGL